MIHKWWHRIVRKRTKPIAEDTAILWKRRLSIAYGLIAWNAFGLVLYSAYKGKADWAYYHGIKSEEEHDKSPGKMFLYKYINSAITYLQYTSPNYYRYK